MIDIFKKKKQAAGGFNHGPIEKREKKLFRLLAFSVAANLILVLGGLCVVLAVSLKPDRVVIADRETGEIIGQYRTTEWRSDKELKGAAMKFTDHFLSMNSKTIDQDILFSLNMMSDELAKRRMQYIRDNNVRIMIKVAKSKSRIQYEQKDKNKNGQPDGVELLRVQDRIATLELKGAIIADTEREDLPEIENYEEQYKLIRQEIPFHLQVKLKMVEVTDTNTLGVKVIDYHEI